MVQFAAKSVYLFSNYHVHKIGNKRTDKRTGRKHASVQTKLAEAQFTVCKTQYSSTLRPVKPLHVRLIAWRICFKVVGLRTREHNASAGRSGWAEVQKHIRSFEWRTRSVLLFVLCVTSHFVCYAYCWPSSHCVRVNWHCQLVRPSMYLLAKCQHNENNNTTDSAEC